MRMALSDDNSRWSFSKIIQGLLNKIRGVAQLLPGPWISPDPDPAWLSGCSAEAMIKTDRAVSREQPDALEGLSGYVGPVLVLYGAYDIFGAAGTEDRPKAVSASCPDDPGALRSSAFMGQDPRQIQADPPRAGPVSVSSGPPRASVLRSGGAPPSAARTRRQPPSDPFAPVHFTTIAVLAWPLTPPLVVVWMATLGLLGYVGRTEQASPAAAASCGTSAWSCCICAWPGQPARTSPYGRSSTS